jgi:glycosyltransferase involved in cell wall biosynthesis
MNRCRVAIMPHKSNLTGGPRTVLSLIRHLDHQRFASVVICPNDGPLVPALQEAGAKVYVIPWHMRFTRPRSLSHWIALLRMLPSAIRFIVRTSRLLSSQQVDVVHVNSIVHVPGALAACLAHKPVVWMIQEILPQGWMASALARMVCGLASKVVVTSEATGQVFPQGSNNIVIGYTGVDLERFDIHSDGTIREELRIGPDPLVTTVTNLIPRKGGEYFVKAAGRIHDACPRVRFLVVGDAPPHATDYKQELIRLSDELGLNGVLRFLGFRKDIPQILADSDVFVLTSVQDPFPWVVLEAMALGKPVVATDVGGLKEAVVTGETGFLVPPEDETAIADAVCLLLQDKERAHKMGQSGYERVKTSFSVDVYVKLMERIYLEVSKKKRQCGETG